MRILICANEVNAPVTGSGRFARMLTYMQQAEPECEIDILSEDHFAGSKYIVPPASLSRIPVIGYYFRSRKYCRAIASILRATEYDALYFNDIWLAYGLLSWLKDHRKTAVISFMHDDNTLNAPDLNRITWRAFTYRVRAFMEKRVIRWLDAVCTNSDYMLQLFRNAYPDIPTYRLYYAGMDYKQVEFQPRLPDPTKRMRVLFMKHDFMRGGLQELILALRMLNHYRFALTIAGPDEAQVQRKLRSQTQSTDQLAITFHGKVNTAAQIQMLYAHHDLVCIPSHQEALGLVNAEALAHGVPVVSSDRGGIPEVLDHGKCGYLVSDIHPSAIAREIEQCITQQDRTKQMVMHGRTFVLERFDLTTMYEQLSQMFRDIAKARQGED